MLVKCSCQVCNEHLEFESRNSGQTVNCPHCGMETLLYIPNIPKCDAPLMPKEQVSAKAAHFPKLPKLALPRPTLQNLICLAAGSVAAFAIMASMGGIKPFGSWGSGKNTTTSATTNGIESPANSAGVSGSKDKNAMHVLAVYRNVNSIVGPQEDLRSIKFSELWADTETYFDQAFLFCGTVKLPQSPAYLPDFTYENGNPYRAVGPDTHSQIVIVSPKRSQNDTEDIVFGFAQKDLAKDLIKLLGADERKSYSGCFVLKIPTELKSSNLYKQSRGFGEQRQIEAEIFAYGPDEATLRKALLIAKASESK